MLSQDISMIKDRSHHTLPIDREYRCRLESALAIILTGVLFGGMFERSWAAVPLLGSLRF